MSFINRQDGIDSSASCYRLLATIRSFAGGLLGSGEDEALRFRHLVYLRSLAGAAMFNVLGADELEWRHCLLALRHDIAAAISFAAEHAPSKGVDLALAMWPHWLVWGRFREGLERLTELLRVGDGLDPSRRAWVSVAAADLAADAGDSPAADGFARAALAQFQLTGDRQGQAYALRALAHVACNRGEGGRAQCLLDMAHARLEPIDDEIGRVHLRQLAGRILMLRGDLLRAERTFQPLLRRFEGLGSVVASARSEWILAEIAHRRGDDALARRLCEASITRLETLDDVAFIARAQHLLGEIAAGEGDRDRAAELFRCALEVSREVGDQRTASGARDGLAMLGAGSHS
jgi:tetratricopeptide (TPR) repeat protein